MGTGWPFAVDTFNDPGSSTLMDASPYQHAANHAQANDALKGLQNSLIGLASYNLWDSRYGTVDDKVLAFDGAVTSGSSTFTSSKITSAAVGKSIVIDGAGSGGQPLVTTISAAANGTATLSATASTTVSGACAVWGTDDTAAWNAMWADWYAHGGGTVGWSGITLVLGQIIIPNDGQTYNAANGAGPPSSQAATVGPWQPSGRLCGIGGHYDGQWGGTIGGYNGGLEGSLMVVANPVGPASLISEGTGALEVDRFAVLMLSPDSIYFFQSTNTTVFAHDGAAIGAPRHLGNGNFSGTSACAQTVFSFGGTGSTYGSGTEAPFQGYGTYCHDWYFDRIQHSVINGTSANCLYLARLTHSLTCGSATAGSSFTSGAGNQTQATAGDAPVYLTTSSVSHYLDTIIVEMGGGRAQSGGYVNGYAVLLENVQYAIVNNPIVVDGQHIAASVYLGSGCTDNLVIPGYRPNPGNVPAVIESASVLGANKVVSPLQADQGCCIMTDSHTGTAEPIASGTEGACLLDGASYDPGSMADTTNNRIVIKISGRYKVFGQVAYFDGNTGGPTSGQVATTISVNGTDSNLGGRFQASGYISTAFAQGVLNLKAGDVLQLRLFQLSGSTVYVYGPNSFLSVMKD